MRANVVILTETKMKQEGTENLGDYYHFFSRGQEVNGAQQRVSLLVRKNVRRHITTREAINQWKIKMSISIYRNELTISRVYDVNEDSPVTGEKDFFQQLYNEIVKIVTTRENIKI